MSTDGEQKSVVNAQLREAQRLVERVRAEEKQLNFLEPLTADEIEAAQDELGFGAGIATVMRHAREKRGGRKPGQRNRYQDDFVRYISQFGQDPAITLMQVHSTAPEELVARSHMLDPAKRRMSYGDAQAMRLRAAEALMPYMHRKQPVAIEGALEGDFNLLIPGLNISEAEAQLAAKGQFVFDAEFTELEDGEGGGDA